MRRIGTTAFAAAALAGAAAAGYAQTRAYTPGPANIELPADWSTRFIRYQTVDNEQRRIVRNIYINPEAYFAARAGQPFPYGTLLILADQRARAAPDGTLLRDAAGRLIPEPAWIAINAQQKERGWGEGYPPNIRNGEWEYARFNGDGTRNNAPVEACFTCHLQNVPNQDFTFTTWPYFANRR
ncbi:MAG TPA: cytochrome P460 family protein [Acetobacteraceae bacterium]|nr:cytochrome P460 family protein [Acetobacteraceae bacterium]